jgi:hypothetical protein
MGIEPDMGDLPLNIDALSVESQLAFEIYQYLPGRWEGMSGSYLGKDLTILPFLFQQYKVDDIDSSHILFLLQYIDGIVSKRIVDKKERDQSLETNKAKWQRK